MNQPLLSILIPTYNRSIELNQLLSQLDIECKPYSDKIEILISDNASPDNTKAVLEKFGADKDQHFPYKIYHQSSNIEACPNFRFLVNIAKGKFTWIIPDDDYLIENKIGDILDILKSYSYNILSLRTEGILDCDAIKKRTNDKLITVSCGEEDYGALAFGSTFCSSCIYRTEIFREKMKEAAEYDEDCYPVWYCYLAIVEVQRKLTLYNHTVVLGNHNMIGPSKLAATGVLILGRLNIWNVFRKTAAGKAIKWKVSKMVFIHWCVIVLGRANDISNFGQVKQFISRVVHVYKLGKIIHILAVVASYIIYLPQMIKKKRIASSRKAIKPE